MNSIDNVVGKNGSLAGESPERTFCFWVQVGEKKRVLLYLGEKEIYPFESNNGISYSECGIKSGGEISKLREGFWLARRYTLSNINGFSRKEFFPFVRTNDGRLYIVPRRIYTDAKKILSLTEKTAERAKIIPAGKSYDNESTREESFEAVALKAFIENPEALNLSNTPLLIYRLK